MTLMHCKIQKASEIAVNTSLPIKMRMRALFFLRNEDSKEAIEAILRLFNDKSVLLKHEAAYVLGQMINPYSLQALIKILENEEEDEIVRHEAAEALGNFINVDQNTQKNILNVLERFSTHENKPISESCFLALKKHEESSFLKNTQLHNKSLKNHKYEENSQNNVRNSLLDVSPFESRDPAFPLFQNNFDEAVNIYLNHPCIYQKYKAMFFLRNLNTKEAVCQLSKGFDNESSLFKHEVAFVYGQMRNPHSIAYLEQALADTSLHGMVRHEAAEALGAIGDERCIDILKRFLNDPVDVVRESVEVALDIHEYENSLEHEYAILT